MTDAGQISDDYNDKIYDEAFFVATEELKRRAKAMCADAIIGMRESIIMDDTFVCFRLQMYGTAVKLKK